MNPAAYSSRNTEELEAICTFENLLDLKFTKPDIKRLDTRPNTDGTIELVDQEQRPLGKIEVQVKKIPDGQTSYQCPIELVAYSERITLPFILICVDVGNRKGYFCHLHRLMMPALKPGQESFVIKFDPKIHSVSKETQYLHQWVEIIEEYKRRVSDYPRLRQIENRVNASDISKDDRIYFQHFIEHVNRLLEIDFPVVKEEFFRDIWKLGVAVFSADPKLVCFHMYKIFPGDPDIRVTGISEHPIKPSSAPGNATSVWLQGTPGSNTVEYHWIARAVLKSPPAAAEDFVLKRLTEMIRTKQIPLFGERLAVEYLFWFVDNYGQSIGVERADCLSVARLNYGLFVYLPAWTSLAVPKFLGEIVRLYRQNLKQVAHMFIRPPFEHVANVYPPTVRPTVEEVAGLIASGNALSPTNISFTKVSPRLLVNSVDFLTASQIESIKRPYMLRSERPTMIWSGYSVDALRHNVNRILVDSLEDYRLFVKRNQIPLKNSLYLNQPAAIVYAADLRSWASSTSFQNCPVLKSYWVENADQKLPKLTFVDFSEFPNKLLVDGNQLKLDGIQRKVIGEGGEIAADLFMDLPMLNRIYEMLTDDLRQDYKQQSFQ